MRFFFSLTVTGGGTPRTALPRRSTAECFHSTFLQYEGADLSVVRHSNTLIFRMFSEIFHYPFDLEIVEEN